MPVRASAGATSGLATTGPGGIDYGYVNMEMSKIKEVNSDDDDEFKEDELLLSQQKNRSKSIATTTLLNQHHKGLLNKNLSIRNPEGALENQLNQQTFQLTQTQLDQLDKLDPDDRLEQLNLINQQNLLDSISNNNTHPTMPLVSATQTNVNAGGGPNDPRPLSPICSSPSICSPGAASGSGGGGRNLQFELPVIPKKQFSKPRIRFNVSGLKIEAEARIFNRFPDTLLGNEEKRKKYWDVQRNEYFFNRHRLAFHSVLFYYQTNGQTLSRAPDVSEEIFKAECEFFGLKAVGIKTVKQQRAIKQLKEKSRRKSQQGKGGISPLKNGNRSNLANVEAGSGALSTLNENDNTDRTESSDFEDSDLDSIPDDIKQSYRARVWIGLDDPNSSSMAKTFGSISTVVIITSILTFTFESLPEIRNFKESTPSKIVFYVEQFCILFFVVEIGLRYWAYPSRSKFFKDWMNVVDIIAILPNFIDLTYKLVFQQDPDAIAINAAGYGTNMMGSPGDVDGHNLLPTYDNATLYEPYSITPTISNAEKGMPKIVTGLTVFRILRVLRMLKLSRQMDSINILMMTIRKSGQEIFVLLVMICTLTVIFGTLIFYAEHEMAGALGESDSNQFKSIPHSYWWCIVTITTVGYGDMYPVTLLGRIIGFFCALTGILCIALPIPAMLVNFENSMRFYRQ